MKSDTTDSTTTQQLLSDAEDTSAFNELFSRYRGYLRRIIGMRLDSRTRRRIDASDVVQKTHLAAIRSLPDFLEKRPIPFRIWLRRLAYLQLRKIRDRHVNAAKRSVTREVQLPHQSSLQLARAVLRHGSTPSEQVNARDLARRVREAVSELDDVDREIVTMLDIEGLSSREVGYILELDPVTVRRRHGAALLRLHRTLHGGGLTESQL